MFFDEELVEEVDEFYNSGNFSRDNRSAAPSPRSNPLIDWHDPTFNYCVDRIIVDKNKKSFIIHPSAMFSSFHNVLCQSVQTSHLPSLRLSDASRSSVTNK